MQLGIIVDKLSCLATCDLLLDAEKVSLKSHLGAGFGPLVLGPLLERQFNSLEPHLWKEGVANTAKVLLVHALQVYRADMPLRRARILLRCLELMYRIGDANLSPSDWIPEKMGNEAERLLQHSVSSVSLEFYMVAETYLLTES